MPRRHPRPRSPWPPRPIERVNRMRHRFPSRGDLLRPLPHFATVLTPLGRAMSDSSCVRRATTCPVDAELPAAWSWGRPICATFLRRIPGHLRARGRLQHSLPPLCATAGLRCIPPTGLPRHRTSADCLSLLIENPNGRAVLTIDRVEAAAPAWQAAQGKVGMSPVPPAVLPTERPDLVHSHTTPASSKVPLRERPSPSPALSARPQIVDRMPGS
jgi:hypothetical protein